MKSSKIDMEKELQDFYIEIAKALPRDGRKTLLDSKAGIESSLAENPDAATDDVIPFVGTPDIAGEYHPDQDGRQLTKEINMEKKIRRKVLVFVFWVVLFFAAAVLISYVFHSYFDKGMIEYEVEVISRTEVTPGDISPADLVE